MLIESFTHFPLSWNSIPPSCPSSPPSSNPPTPDQPFPLPSCPSSNPPSEMRVPVGHQGLISALCLYNWYSLWYLSKEEIRMLFDTPIVFYFSVLLLCQAFQSYSLVGNSFTPLIAVWRHQKPPFRNFVPPRVGLTDESLRGFRTFAADCTVESTSSRHRRVFVKFSLVNTD